MTNPVRRTLLWALSLAIMAGCSLPGSNASSNSEGKYTKQDAARMIRASRHTLMPVYAPLAEHLVEALQLDEKTGVGIDIGSGPGTLIIELCKRTQLHWVNADINPHFFTGFYKDAARSDFGHRVSAVWADAQALPFRSDYADVIVSRGSFHFWKDKVKAFGEIYRVLKPGAVAYIGRGFSKNLPIKTAKKIRAGQGGKIKYSVGETATELQEVMDELGIKDYSIHRPRVDAEVNYGIWIEFQKDTE